MGDHCERQYVMALNVGAWPLTFQRTGPRGECLGVSASTPPFTRWEVVRSVADGSRDASSILSLSADVGHAIEALSPSLSGGASAHARRSEGDRCDGQGRADVIRRTPCRWNVRALGCHRCSGVSTNEVFDKKKGGHLYQPRDSTSQRFSLTRRPLCRTCIAGVERKNHLGGRVGADVFSQRLSKSGGGVLRRRSHNSRNQPQERAFVVCTRERGSLS